MEYKYIWTDGTNADFVNFSRDMEEYYNRLVGGENNRKSFIPHNALVDIHDVLMVYNEDIPIACASFKEYDVKTVEIKRVWVSDPYRGQHISKEMMDLLEQKAKEKGYKRAVLQTRQACVEAVSLYKNIGYMQIENYPPYVGMPLAVCYAKEL